MTKSFSESDHRNYVASDYLVPRYPISTTGNPGAFSARKLSCIEVATTVKAPAHWPANQRFSSWVVGPPHVTPKVRADAPSLQNFADNFACRLC